MSTNRYDQLAREFREGRIDRREVMKRASALGLSASGLAMLLTMGYVPASLAAQEASPAAEVSDQLLTASDEQTTTWVRNFNPLLPQSSSHRWPTQHGIYEPLFIYTTINAEIVPWLATGWSFNEDNTVLTFTTRDNVTWSDGTPFTANDVAFTFTPSISSWKMRQSPATEVAWWRRSSNRSRRLTTKRRSSPLPSRTPSGSTMSVGR